jgi:hypothetical protein
MSFEHKPGRGSLYPNEKRETEKHSHFRGTVKTPDGKEMWINMWLVEPVEGKKLPAFNVSLAVKNASTSNAGSDALAGLLAKLIAS